MPEVGYYHTDVDSEGRPCPRGELLTRGPGIFLGYFRDPYLTKQVKDRDNWFHTGDLAMVLPQNGALKFIGRRKTTFKLSNGELIVPERVEELLLRSQLIDDVYIYGDSEHSFIVAIVVPKKTTIDHIAKMMGAEGTHEEIYKSRAIREEFTMLMNESAGVTDLATFEKPKNIWLEPKTFMERGVLTQMLMIKRHVAL